MHTLQAGPVGFNTVKTMSQDNSYLRFANLGRQARKQELDEADPPYGDTPLGADA
jgi:hypothetical protein